MILVAESEGQITVPQQPVSNMRNKTIPVADDMDIRLDSLSIIPSTFLMPGIDSNAYSLDAVNAVLHWKVKPQLAFVNISYRVFPVKLNTSSQRMNFDSLLMNSASPVPVPVTPKASERNLFDFGNINAQGSFGRQVGFGNNQSAVLNSNMNIQLSGYHC